MFNPSDEQKAAMIKGGKVKQMADSNSQQLKDKLQMHDLKYKLDRQAIIDSHKKQTAIKPPKARKKNSNGN